MLLSQFIDNLKALVKNSLNQLKISQSQSHSLWKAKFSSAYQKALGVSLEKLQPFLSSPTAIFIKKRLPNPQSTLQNLSFCLMLATAACAATWAMKLVQLETPPSSNQWSPRGTTLYSSIEPNTVSSLFGRQPIAKNSITLQGIVITGKDLSGALSGFALFDLDGKPTGPVAVGESPGKGLSLQSIGTDEAILQYGEESMNIKLEVGQQKKKKNVGATTQTP